MRALLQCVIKSGRVHGSTGMAVIRGFVEKISWELILLITDGLHFQSTLIVEKVSFLGQLALDILKWYSSWALCS